MALHIVRTRPGAVAGQPVLEALGEALGREGRALLLVPDFSRQLVASRELADAGLGLGLQVTTPSAWVRERWEVWGDGRRVVSEVARPILMRRAVRASADSLDANPGTVEVLCELARQALPWLPLDDGMSPDVPQCSACGLTDAETEAVGVVGRYARDLRAQGLVEESEAADGVVGRLAQAGCPVPPVVVTGFTAPRRAERELVAELALRTDVTLLVTRGNDVADQGTDILMEDVAARAASRGVPCDRAEVPVGEAVLRDDELDDVLRSLFQEEGRVSPTGAVELLHAAGPTAEAELVARHVSGLAQAGDREVVVCAPDGRRAWRELAPKLWARGVSVTGELSVPLAQLEAGRAFLEFAQTVSQLQELARDWPEPVQNDDGTTTVRLGDMSWWPPRALVDFLLSDIAGLPTSRVHRLDAAWRGDRLLTPADVLDQLQNAAVTSPAVARATSELLRGHVGTAASKLLASFVGRDGGKARVDDVVPGDDGEVLLTVPRATDELADAEAAGVLQGVLGIAGTLKELGISADRKAASPVPLAEVVEELAQAMRRTRLRLAPRAEAEGATCEARILSPASVARLEPGSADAVVCCGLTSAEDPVGNGDDVLTALLVRCGVETGLDPVAERRGSFVAQLGVARHHLALERALRDRGSSVAYPSVMLVELLACYGASDDGDGERVLPTVDASELDAVRNVSPTGSLPVREQVEDVLPAGQVSPRWRPYIVVPPTGSAELPDGRPLLSASQIESYLECPYKWFSLRRLGLGDVDAGFGNMEMGTFAHRVLQVTHERLLEHGLDDVEVREGRRPDVATDPRVRVPGSRVTLEDVVTRERACRILEEEFDEHLAHQSILQGKRSRYQAFVPHTDQDRGMLRTLRRDLLSELDYEAGCFLGYEPRYFEWGFGKKGQLVPYAGAYLTGTIDRVDVDAHGQAVVIDYKHKSATGFFAEYAALPKGGQAPGEDLALPRRVQALIYAQVVRRQHPELKVTAAVYLGTRGDHALSGAVAANASDNVFGAHVPSRQSLARVVVDEDETFGSDGARGMETLLDRTEERVAEGIRRMLAGDIEADPVDDDACLFCPAIDCPRRRK